MSVAGLMAAIKGALADRLPGKLRVVGEISNLSDRNHWFFSLKDGDAVIRCVMFASSVKRVRFKVRDGAEVVATGRVDVYPAQGSVQFYVDKLEPVGEGALEQRLRELIDELRGEGYFDPEHKRALPAVPTRIAVVTSRSAAALQDVIDTARRRWAGCELVLLDVRVQGDQAAQQIAKALRTLDEHGEAMGIDAIILTRGGGSIEDLWAFNERIVADAVYRCRLPIVAAIGHETDVTVAELVADHRCATPTQAAMTLVPDREMLERQIEQARHRLTLALRRRAEHARERLQAVQRHPAIHRPQRLVVRATQSLDALIGRLDRAMPALAAARKPQLETLSRALPLALKRRAKREQDALDQLARALPLAMTRRLARERESLDALARQLDAVGPQRVLARGYTYTLGPDQQLIRSAKTAKQLGQLTTVFADGRVASQVEGSAAPTTPSPAPIRQSAANSDPDSPAKPAAKRAKNPRRRSRKPPPAGPSLFDATDA